MQYLSHHCFHRRKVSKLIRSSLVSSNLVPACIIDGGAAPAKYSLAVTRPFISALRFSLRSSKEFNIQSQSGVMDFLYSSLMAKFSPSPPQPSGPPPPAQPCAATGAR